MPETLYTDCLLDSTNKSDADGDSVGNRIISSGKGFLWNERPESIVPDVIVIHYISAEETRPEAPFSFPAILRRFCDCGVSSHYLIARNGKLYRLVPEEYRAWHCGGSIMPEPDNRRNVNDFSIGIEFAATADSGFTDEQYLMAATLYSRIVALYQHPFTLVGHETIAGERAVSLGLRQTAKSDPGPVFEWERVCKRLA